MTPAEYKFIHVTCFVWSHCFDKCYIFVFTEGDSKMTKMSNQTFVLFIIVPVCCFVKLFTTVYHANTLSTLTDRSLISCDVSTSYTTVYAASQKREVHNFVHNFDKFWLIFKIISLLDSELNWKQNSYHISHHTLSYTLWNKNFHKWQYLCISHTWQLGHWTIKYQLLPNWIIILCFSLL